MFYWLIELSNSFPPGFGALRTLLNVFRYITFRTGGAVVTAALFVFLFGPWIIDHLRIRQGKGQPIRADGPPSHIISKKGTPTMGGLMILSGLVVATVLWANPLNPYVWIVLAVTLGFGFVGFYDDYLKVTKQTSGGFAGRVPVLVHPFRKPAVKAPLSAPPEMARYAVGGKTSVWRYAFSRPQESMNSLVISLMSWGSRGK